MHKMHTQQNYSIQNEVNEWATGSIHYWFGDIFAQYLNITISLKIKWQTETALCAAEHCTALLADCTARAVWSAIDFILLSADGSCLHRGYTCLGKCPARNGTVQLSTNYTDPEVPSEFPTEKFPNSFNNGLWLYSLYYAGRLYTTCSK